MRCRISHFFTYSSYCFDFSYKISLTIQARINQEILRNIVSREPVSKGWLIDVQIDTNNRYKKVTLKQTIIDKKNKIVSYVIIFPYNRVVNSKSPQDEYISMIFEGIEQVFQKLNIKTAKLVLIKKDVIKQFKSKTK